MSSFQDFDAFLKSQQHEATAIASQKRELINNVRNKHDAIIKAVFRITKEYHETIIHPRIDSILILKKHEPTESRSSFIYRANVVPTDFLPPAFRATDIIERVDYLNPKEITSHDWHANVALQISLHLEFIGDNLQPSLHVRSKTWGKPNQTHSILPSSVSVKDEEEKRTPYTITTLKLAESNSERFLKEYEQLLMVFTPLVLDHRNIVWKK